MMAFKEYQFQGQTFLLIGEDDGPLATKEQFENGIPSYAHLMPDGRIMRHYKQIGEKADPVPTGNEVEAQMSWEGVGNMLDDFKRSLG